MTTQNKISHCDVLIIGGGAAGLSAAMPLGRLRRSVLICDEGLPRNRFATHIHNLPGHDGTPPEQWYAQVHQELTAYPTVQHLHARVETLNQGQGGFEAQLSTGERVHTQQVILAYGIRDTLPEIPGVQELWGKSVVHCPFCHGFEFQDQKLALFGNSPMALHLLPMLQGLSEQVMWLSHGPSALSSEQKKLLQVNHVHLNEHPVKALLHDENTLTAVQFENDTELPCDAVFLAPQLPFEPNSTLGQELGCEQNDLGQYVVDSMGQTTVKGVYAVGDLSGMHAMSQAIYSGGTAGAAIAKELLTQRFESAPERPGDFWTSLYERRPRKALGNPGKALQSLLQDLPPGKALELGSSRGDDAIWLAQQGWHVTGVDIALNAIETAKAFAKEAGVSARTDFRSMDLTRETPTGKFDLVMALFFQSPIDFPRDAILNKVAGQVASGGYFLTVTHGSVPPWNGMSDFHEFPTPQEEYAALKLDPNLWEIVCLEARERQVTGPQKQETLVKDNIVFLKRI